MLVTDEWKKALQLGIDLGKPAGRFIEDQNVAMHAEYIDFFGKFEELHKQGVDYNWDLVSYPITGRRPEKACEASSIC